MMRNKAYTIINIFGLSMGVVCCLLLVDYINDEGNQRQSNINDIPHATSIMPDEHGHTMRTAPTPIARRIKDEAPETAHTPRNTSPADAEQLVRYNDKAVHESEGLSADSTDIISSHSRSRNPKKALV